MAQGKLKIKAKLPNNMVNKKQQRKGTAFTKRTNRPIQSKKLKHQETQKLKEVISKNVNRAVEDEIRARADTNKKNLSKAQQAVAKHHSGGASVS